MRVPARNNVVVTGPAGGRPMVFAHGFGCDQHMWRAAPAFADRYRVVTFDHVGAGGAGRLRAAVHRRCHRRTPGRAFFDDDRLAATFAAGYGEPAAATVERIGHEVTAFQFGLPRDDIALLALRVPV